MMPLCRPLADVLKHRGVADPERFVSPSSWGDLPSPFHLEGMEEAVAVIMGAVRSHKRVAIYGDYVERALMLSGVRRTGMNAARFPRDTPHNPDAVASGIGIM